jgi:hypothetical protein
MDSNVIVLLLTLGSTSLGILILEWKDATKKQKIGLFVLIVINCVLTGFAIMSQIGNDEKETRIAQINKNHSDTLKINLDKTLEIIEAQNKLLDSTKELKDAYYKLHKLEEKQLMQVLGGHTSPEFQIHFYLKTRLVENLKTNQRDSVEFYYEVFVQYLNKSEYYLKAFTSILKSNVNYPNIRKFVNKGDKLVPVFYEAERDDSNTSFELSNTTLGTLPPRVRKGCFRFEMPVGDDEYRFDVYAEWNNGFYSLNLAFIPNPRCLKPKFLCPLILKDIKSTSSDVNRKVPYYYWTYPLGIKY